MKWILLTLLTLGAISCDNFRQAKVSSNEQLALNNIDEAKKVKIKQAIKGVEPLFKLMGKPKPDDWLANFPENGQTFDEYIVSNPTLPSEERKTLYIQPIGNFNQTQKKVISLTAEGIKEFFGLPVKLLDERRLEDNLPAEDFRLRQQLKTRQIRSGYFLEKVLPSLLPQDAAALIAFTSEDLYPDPTMNYVFGQASLEKRVGVWSLYRLGNESDFKLLLMRTLKIATHETGHMFSIQHCTKYECGMSGSNNLDETDRHPLDFCSECMAKIFWMSNYEPQNRYERLANFFQKLGYMKEAEDFQAKAKTIQSISALQ